MKVLSAIAFVACLAGVSPADAQTLPAEPIALAGGRVTISGDVAGSYGSRDAGWFDYTDYNNSALRTLRIDFSAAATVGEHITLLGEVRSDNLGRVRPYALYVRMRPWTNHNINVQVGLVPPTFGAFPRRMYPNDNPLIGYPLAYQYLTTLRPDAVPGDAEELLQKRSSGWLVRYRYGNPGGTQGVPLVTAFRWDTGVQVHAGTDVVRGTVAVTTGTLAHPLFHDDNNGRQVVGRLELRPVAGLIVGASGARGPFVSEMAARGAVGDGHDREFTQTAWGTDIEYSRGYYLVRYEGILSEWRLPLVRAPYLKLPLRALSTSIEGRYKFSPGFYAAARFDHLGFSEMTGSAVQGTLPWDSDVTRAEAGIGYYIQRNLLMKLSVQRNMREGGRVVPRASTLAAGQLVFWF
jgi:hypothetical protein